MADILDSKPVVAVVMGSSSDWETMRHARIIRGIIRLKLAIWINLRRMFAVLLDGL